MTGQQSGVPAPVGADDHVQGAAGATIVLIEYGDYECPYCGMAYPIVKRLQERLGDRMRFVFRNFPLAELHPHALAAAELAEAAARQGKFWEMHDMLFEHQRALTPSDLSAYAARLDLDLGALEAALRDPATRERVRSDFRGGVRSGVNGTPTFFINGKRYDGDWRDERSFVAALTEAG